MKTLDELKQNVDRALDRLDAAEQIFDRALESGTETECDAADLERRAAFEAYEAAAKEKAEYYRLQKAYAEADKAGMPVVLARPKKETRADILREALKKCGIKEDLYNEKDLGNILVDGLCSHEVCSVCALSRRPPESSVMDCESFAREWLSKEAE